MPLRLLRFQRLLRRTLALIFALLALCSLGLALSLARLAAW
jgi:hypothetical protein